MDWRPLPLARRSVNVARELAALARLVRLYRDLRPDVAHHFTLECIVLGSLAAWLARVPAVVNAAAGLGSVFAGRSRRARLLQRPVSALLKWAFARSEVILQNPDDLECLVAAGVVAQTHAHLIRGSGVDVSRFAAAHPALAPGAGKVLFASRLLYSKGVADFVEAARRLRTRLPGASFLVAGKPDPGSLDAVSRHDLERWHREAAVELLGHQDDMPALLAGVSLVVLPTYYGEGVPRILVEAAAAGLPLVATDAPGCREVVRHGENGLLVPPHDPQSLADAIAALLLDPARRAQMGERSRAIAVQTFAEDSVLRQTMAVYRIALQPPRAQGTAQANP
jgi:glycosyltransferase involved in cell wall biosynthesis